MSTCDQAIYWHEGMFLTPQHFQVAEQRAAHLRQLGSQWDNHYNWGLRAIDVDADALANHRLVVRRLRARMPDGELLSFPEDGSLPVLDLLEALSQRPATTIFLALPLRQQSRANSSDDSSQLATRYLVGSREAVDQNTGAGAVAVQVVTPNARLLAEGDDLSGFVVLPIGRVCRAENSTGSPTVDREFIPPVLACDAWPPLLDGVLSRLLDRVERKAELLAARVVSRRVRFESQGAGEQLMLEQLRSLQEAAAVLRVDVTAQGTHPIVAYRELARLVGRLSIFAGDARLRRLPAYNHDDLAGCFLVARRELEDLLSHVTEPSFQERVFVAKDTLLRTELEPEWTGGDMSLFLGVQSSLPADEVERLLGSGRNIKFGCSNRAESLFLMGQAGLRPQRVAHLPRALPIRQGMQYYVLTADDAPEEWRHVERSLTLGARLSEQIMVDDFTEHDTVVLDVNGKSATLKLSIFAVQDENASTPLKAAVTQGELATAL